MQNQTEEELLKQRGLKTISRDTQEIINRIMEEVRALLYEKLESVDQAQQIDVLFVTTLNLALESFARLAVHLSKEHEEFMQIVFEAFKLRFHIFYEDALNEQKNYSEIH